MNTSEEDDGAEVDGNAQGAERSYKLKRNFLLLLLLSRLPFQILIIMMKQE